MSVNVLVLKELPGEWVVFYAAIHNGCPIQPPLKKIFNHK